MDRYNEIIDRFNGPVDRYNKLVDLYNGRPLVGRYGLVSRYNGLVGS